MRRRSPASCPRFVSRRTGAPGGGGKRMHSGAPPAAAYSIGFEGQTPLTPEYARGKETRTVPRARHRTEVAQISARNRVNPPDRTRGKPRIRIRN